MTTSNEMLNLLLDEHKRNVAENRLVIVDELEDIIAYEFYPLSIADCPRGWDKV